MTQKSDRFKGLKYVLILIIGFAIVYLYWGFYSPDPYILNRYPISKLLLWGLRVLIPILILGIVILKRLVSRKRVSKSNIILMFSTLLIFGVIGFLFANHVYQKTYHRANKTDAYHPYLQLKPNNYFPENTASADELRIFCLGGSTTEFGDKQGRGWPDRVQSLMKEKYPDQNIKIFNQGRQWYTSLHSLINYSTNIRPYKPDIVIVMHAINDILHNADFSYFSHNDFRRDYGHFYGPVTRIMYRESLSGFLFRMTKGLWYHKPREIVDQHGFPGLNSFRNHLTALIDLAERDGTQVILMTQPSLYKENMDEQELAALYMLNNEAIGPTKKWNAKTALSAFQQYNAVIRELGDMQSVQIIDLDKSIPKTLEYFSDDVHYTYPTFDRIAASIADSVKLKD